MIPISDMLRRLTAVVLLVAGGVGAAACPEDQDSLLALLAEAGKSMRADPHRSLDIVQGMAVTDSCYDNVRLRHALLTARAEIAAGMPLSVGEATMSEVIGFCDCGHRRADQAWGCYCMSELYRAGGRDSLALVYARRAADIASRIDDRYLDSMVYSHLAMIMRDSTVAASLPAWLSAYDRDRVARVAGDAGRRRSMTDRIVTVMAVCMVALALGLVVHRLIVQHKLTRLRITRQRMSAILERQHRQIADQYAALDRHAADRERIDRLSDMIGRHHAVMKRIRDVGSMTDGARVRLCADMALTEEEADHLIELTDVTGGGVVTRLRRRVPDLQRQDLALCCLIIAGVPNADIALLLGCGMVALKKRKTRLRTDKLGLGPDEDLDSWLRHT